MTPHRTEIRDRYRQILTPRPPAPNRRADLLAALAPIVVGVVLAAIALAVLVIYYAPPAP